MCSTMKPDDDKIDEIDLDFLELFDSLNPKDIVKLLNAIGGKFTSEDGNTIKKLVTFIYSLEDDQIDNLLDAFDEIMEGK